MECESHACLQNIVYSVCLENHIPCQWNANKHGSAHEEAHAFEIHDVQVP